MIGGGRATELHVSALKRVASIEIRLKTVMARDYEHAKCVMREYGFEKCTICLNDILDDPEIDVVDICTPPNSHFELVRKIIAAGKHVICEKPLHGMFEENLLSGGDSSKLFDSYHDFCTELDEMGEFIEKSGMLFMYAENFVYAPAITKAAEIIKAKKSRLLYIKGEESLKGSSSPVAGEWSKTGGGSLMRVGSHPLSTAIFLKQIESEARGVDIAIEGVVADVGCVIRTLSEHEHRYIAANPLDVEDTATVLISFSDSSRACIIANDTLLGGSNNYVDAYCNDAVLRCQLTMNDIMKAYVLDEEGLDDVYFSEMLQSKCGWNNPFIADEVIRGYVNEMQDFMECIAGSRQPRAGFKLASDTVKIIYVAYLSSATGVKIMFKGGMPLIQR